MMEGRRRMKEAGRVNEGGREEGQWRRDRGRGMMEGGGSVEGKWRKDNEGGKKEGNERKRKERN